MRMRFPLAMWALLALSACGGGGAGHDTEIIFPDGDPAEAVEHDRDPAESEAETSDEAETCAYDEAQSCDGNTRVYCGSGGRWMRQDCGAAVCTVVGAAVAVCTEADGDVESEEAADSQSAADGDSDAESAEADSDAETGDVADSDGDTASEFGSDSESDSESDSQGSDSDSVEPVCGLADPAYCQDGLLYVCQGGQWAAHDCAPLVCLTRPDDDDVCGTTSEDGDQESEAFDCRADATASGPRLLLDKSRMGAFAGFQDDTILEPLVVCNNGRTDMHLWAARLLGIPGGGFRLPYDLAAPVVIVPGDYRTILVEAGWPEAGAYGATLRLSSDSSTPVVDVPLGLNLTGRGELTALPSRVLNFPQDLGAHRSLVILNSGQATLQLDAPTILGGGFTITSQSVP